MAWLERETKRRLVVSQRSNFSRVRIAQSDGVVEDEAMIHLSKQIRLFTISVFSFALLLVVSIAHARPLTRSEVGELFIFGISGTEVDAQTEKHLLAACPGSLLLFRRNLVSNQQTISLIDQLRTQHRKCSSSPLFVGLDQEGGQVARIPFDPPMPSPWAIGATKDPALAESLGYEVGLGLRKLGFNMNLAPVLDLGNAHHKSFIGVRSFGDQPDQVGEMGSAFSFGLVRARVLPVAKHFPGIGAITNDPHKGLVRRTASSDSLWQNDLRPFKVFANLFPTGIMPSHLIYKTSANSAEPGTFSKSLLQGWLRERLNYRGLVISDDLLMKGAQENHNLGESVVTALNAGVDLVMVSWSFKSQRQAVDAVFSALRSGKISESLLREKIGRIQKTKLVIGDSPPSPHLAGSQLLLMGSQNYTDLAFETLRKNLAGQRKNFPLQRPEEIYIWPQDLRLKWQIERAIAGRVYLLPQNQKALESLKEESLVLAFARTTKEATELSHWSKSLKSKTMVINQMAPGMIANGFQKEIPVFLQHPMIAAEVGSTLQNKWRPLISNR